MRSSHSLKPNVAGIQQIKTGLFFANNLIVRKINVGFTLEHRNHDLHALILFIDLSDAAGEILKQTRKNAYIIADMNIVLEKIVPGLTIGQKHLGTQLLKNGATGVRFQLLSNKNGKAISLQYESEGIKKMISIMHLLIAVYNRPSVTVAIDELDSGVFEYLLGELLRIISEKGKGQLIFTSHNLRPLETLDRGFIAFTTTNPDNRYIRLCNVKNNHNLRDFYYRDIVLGEQSEEIYDPTNNYEIAFAFREAGDFGGA